MCCRLGIEPRYIFPSSLCVSFIAAALELHRNCTGKGRHRGLRLTWRLLCPICKLFVVIYLFFFFFDFLRLRSPGSQSNRLNKGSGWLTSSWAHPVTVSAVRYCFHSGGCVSFDTFVKTLKYKGLHGLRTPIIATWQRWIAEVGGWGGRESSRKVFFFIDASGCRLLVSRLEGKKKQSILESLPAVAEEQPQEPSGRCAGRRSLAVGI